MSETQRPHPWGILLCCSSLMLSYGVVANGQVSGSNLTQGEPIVATSSTQANSSPIFLDASQFGTLTNCTGCISTAISHLPANGGVVITPSGYRETITSQIDLGDGSSKAVTLVLSPDTVITCKITSGTNCFVVHNASAITSYKVGTLGEPPLRTGGAAIILDSTANVASIVQNGERTGNGQAYFAIDNVWLENVSGATVTSCLDLADVNGQAVIRDTQVLCRGAIGINLTVPNAPPPPPPTNPFSGPYALDNVWSNNAGVAGGQPLKVMTSGSSFVSLEINGGGYLNPGDGNPCINIDGSGNATSALRGVRIRTYVQDETSNTGVIGIKLRDVNDVDISGAVIVMQGTNDTGIDISQSNTGRVRAIAVTASEVTGTGTGFGINNHITGEQFNGAQQHWLQYYYSADSFLNQNKVTGGSASIWADASNNWEFGITSSLNTSYEPLSMNGSALITVGHTTVGVLPSASSHAGAMIEVTDSTTISSEGQTCVGSSSHTALAFSNGSVWKCF